MNKRSLLIRSAIASAALLAFGVGAGPGVVGLADRMLRPQLEKARAVAERVGRGLA